MPFITNGTNAPAEKGKNETKTIQNFFNQLIVFKYIIFCIKCDIIDKIKYIKQRMSSLKHRFLSILKPVALTLVTLVLCATPVSAHADIIDALNLAPFIPTVLDSFMLVATGGYEFFVGKGDGIIYILIWGFLAVSMALYLIKMYFPKTWVSFFGFSGGGEMIDGKADGMTIASNLLKPAFRAIIAATVLLQLKPVYLTEWLVNPFLQFGALYTESITSTLNESGIKAEKIECPPSIIEKGWISQSSCEFMVQPVADISHANNQIIKRGFEFFKRGLRGLITLIPHGGEDFLNLVTGIFLIMAFVSSNLFMALLIIQAIFNFGMALILYPFQVLAYVAKPNDKWFDIWPAFAGITKALQQLVITMIACTFILCINIAVVKSLFQWGSSKFVVAAGGSASSNVPQVANSAMGFGEYSILWLSSIMTFYLMLRIFNITRDKLKEYAGSGMDNLYNTVKKDTQSFTQLIKKRSKQIGTVLGWTKK